MKFILLPLFFCVSALQGAPAPDSAALSSANAAYDGNVLHLTGHVLLDHGLGKMAADEAHLQRQDNGKEFPFSLIQLNQNVHLGLKTGAEIHCGGAELDFIKLRGVLTCLGEEKVVYADTLKKGLFRLLGKNVELKICKKEGEEKKGDFAIDSILAKDEVAIEFGNFSLLAHQALYRKAQDEEKPGAEFQGVVTAYPKDEKNPCRLIHELDLIEADTIDLDLIHSKVSLLHPKGVLASLLMPGMQKGAVQFSSDHLLWDRLKNSLFLKGHVNIVESLLGTLVTEELEIVETPKKQQRILKSIRTKGNTSILFTDQGGTTHRLAGHGPFLFDREKLRATFDSPKSGGKIPLSKQIYYETEGVGLFGNQAHLEYNLAQEKIHPTTLTLTGNIRLFSIDEKKPRFALADRLSFSTTTKTAILAAAPGKHVLFVDESQALRLAAQEIHITRDPKTNEERVQGIGTVLFTFTDEENSLLRKIFPNYKAPK